MLDGGGVTFSVVYFDGATETTVGEVTVDSSFNFNKFLSFLSQKIGISPHQFSVYLATFGSNRKIPITAKVNFATIVRDNAASASASSFFFVKRSKRPRRNKVRSNKGSRNNDNKINNPPANAVLLRRNAAVPFSGFDTLAAGLGRVGFEKRIMDLQMERERFLMSMGIGNLCLGRETPTSGGDCGGVVCDECSMGMDGGFHRCVFDPVTVCFRSPAGPVARPVKSG